MTVMRTRTAAAAAAAAKSMVINDEIATVVAPTPTSKIEYHDWTTIMYRVAKGNSRTRNNPIIITIAIAIANTTKRTKPTVAAMAAIRIYEYEWRR